jgi:hypothetical protein
MNVFARFASWLMSRGNDSRRCEIDGTGIAYQKLDDANVLYCAIREIAEEK